MSRIMPSALNFQANLKYVFDSGASMNVFVVLIISASPNWKEDVVLVEHKAFKWKYESK